MLAKAKLYKIEVIISKLLTNPFNRYDEFVLANDVLKEYDEMKEEIRHLKT